jgi:hypothetical protein
MRETLLTCEICGNDFLAKRSDAHYCSGACKQQAYLQRLGVIGSSSKRRVDRGRITAHLMLGVNQFLTLMSHDMILRIEVEPLAQQLFRLHAIIPEKELPDHFLLASNVKTLVDYLLGVMQAGNKNALLLEVYKKPFTKYILDLKNLSMRVVTYTYPLNSF